MPEFDDDNKTIFSTDLDSEERSAVKSGEERGKREAMKDDPKRFARAGRDGRSIRRYEEWYVKVFKHD